MKSPQENINAARIQKERIDEALPVAWAMLIVALAMICSVGIVHVVWSLLTALPLNCAPC